MESSPTITPSTVFRHCGDVRYRIIDGEAVVVRQEAGEVLGLNQTAARLLDLIDAKSTVSDLIDAMAEEFAAERTALEKDVTNFLIELLSVGVIEDTRNGQECA
jgi:hypothetical protein